VHFLEPLPIKSWWSGTCVCVCVCVCVWFFSNRTCKHVGDLSYSTESGGGRQRDSRKAHQSRSLQGHALFTRVNCKTLQRIATHAQHTITHCNPLQHPALHTPQHATQHTATHHPIGPRAIQGQAKLAGVELCDAIHWNRLQHATKHTATHYPMQAMLAGVELCDAIHCNRLQHATKHTATHYPMQGMFAGVNYVVMCAWEFVRDDMCRQRVYSTHRPLRHERVRERTA